ncbi:class I SAM-dependent methyltransferase [Gulosibacter molinativorax]|uniref:Class I SAM-dependent methyltransferase n=1 Tax=Gulosibacter molinativorax TaxID=256821 RepID=A0ABT7CAB9_9MICO|nr:methyltransferase [Gulosibacter molinativorax]MDJ1371596.1 class I SAM-dependent methyltransferase [Gulosibacter molinativorax]QUY61061.1 Ribosomal RNA small subunit methyltransferase C [Gulosibacter molinativorax]
MAEHYFAENPQAQERKREIDVNLRGRELTVTTANAVFSGEHLDRATRILLEDVPAPPTRGNALDLGCGWGPIALALALESPDLDVWAIDVNERAIELTAQNAKRHSLDNIHAGRSEDVPADITFDVIWSNPPIRIGKAALDELLGTWLPRLAPGGEAWLVVGKNLGADSLQKRLAASLGDDYEVERHSTSGGFRILRITRF